MQPNYYSYPPRPQWINRTGSHTNRFNNYQTFANGNGCWPENMPNTGCALGVGPPNPRARIIDYRHIANKDSGNTAACTDSEQQTTFIQDQSSIPMAMGPPIRHANSFHNQYNKNYNHNRASIPPPMYRGMRPGCTEMPQFRPFLARGPEQCVQNNLVSSEKRPRPCHPSEVISSHDSWKNYDQKIRSKPKVNKKDKHNFALYCVACDRGYNNADAFREHNDGHVQCDMEGCKYEAAAKLVKLHYKMQHSAGGGTKIWKLDTPDDIRKWREERKRKYPTVENVTKKATSTEEKHKRGEVLETEKFGKMNKKRFHRNRKREMLPPRDCSDGRAPEGEESAACKNTDAEFEAAAAHFEASDVAHPEPPEKCPKLVDEEQTAVVGSFMSPHAVTDSSQKRENKKRSRIRTRTKKMKRVENSQPALKMGDSLLKKLLAADIRHERNVILQCVRYVVQRHFFDHSNDVVSSKCRPQTDSTVSNSCRTWEDSNEQNIDATNGDDSITDNTDTNVTDTNDFTGTLNGSRVPNDTSGGNDVTGIVNNINCLVNRAKSPVKDVNGVVNNVKGPVNDVSGLVNDVNCPVNDVNCPVNDEYTSSSVNDINRPINDVNIPVNDVNGRVNDVNGRVNDVNGRVSNAVNDVNDAVNDLIND